MAMVQLKAYKYKPLISRLGDKRISGDWKKGLDFPDRRDGLIYDYEDKLHLAVELALATGRPLLLRGDPGTGKSSLAAYVARNLNWRYYEHTVTGDTKAQDLLWKFDLVRRLADAQARANAPGMLPLNDLDYIEPGILWWVFNATSAKQRGFLEANLAKRVGVRRPSIDAQDPFQETNIKRKKDRAVVLIDELDKADPEVPNALLVPLGSNKFFVSDIGTEITWAPRPRLNDGAAKSSKKQLQEKISRLLVVITTNEERQLPPAFLRRCVICYLDHPDVKRLVKIAKLHFGRNNRLLSSEETKISEEIAKRVVDLRKLAQNEMVRPPSTAEYLDALRACYTLNIKVSDEYDSEWKVVERAVLLKNES